MIGNRNLDISIELVVMMMMMMVVLLMMLMVVMVVMVMVMRRALGGEALPLTFAAVFYGKQSYHSYGS